MNQGANAINFSPWLEKALNGNMSDPSRGDENYHIRALRVVERWDEFEREQVEEDCIKLVQNFSELGKGDPDYICELLCFASAFCQSERIASPLEDLANRFKSLDLPVRVRSEVLNALADMKPHRSAKFWNGIIDLWKQEHVHSAISGLLHVDRESAAIALTLVSDDQMSIDAAILKFEMAYDETPEWARNWFLFLIEDALIDCNGLVAAAFNDWIQRQKA